MSGDVMAHMHLPAKMRPTHLTYQDFAHGQIPTAIHPTASRCQDILAAGAPAKVP